MPIDAAVEADQRTPQAWRVAAVAATSWGVALAVVVAADGRPIWRLVRLALVGIATAGLLWAARRRGGAALVVAGTVGLAVGVGIGARHAAVADFDSAGVAGLVALAAGAVLVVVGITRVVRGRRRRTQALAVPALVLAVLLGAWVLVPALLATNVPTLRLGDARPDVPYEDVTFPATDGVTLSAWYLPSTNGAAVVVRHGSGSTRTAALAQAEVLARNGYGVLLTDARGHGRSGGRAMDFGWYGDADIGGAVSYLAARPDVDPARIAVLGLSMGAEEAIGAAAADARVAAVVAEGATARTDADKAWFADVFGLRGRVQLGLEWLQYRVTDLLTAAAPPTPLAEAAAAAVPRPIMLVAAGDVADESRSAEHVQAASPGNVTVWVVPGAGHTQGLATDPSGWEERVVGFLDRALARA